MKNIIIAPGAFKNSLSPSDVARAIHDGLKRSGLSATYHICPIADGGNGTLDVFLSHGGSRYTIEATNPLGETISADFGILDDGQTAVIEMAQASGIELIDTLDAMNSTTYGTGQLMQAALEHGVRKFIIGMGGSATVDGGSGCLKALGIKFLDKDGNPIPSGGGSLNRIHTIDTSELDPRWQEVEVIIASDVDNPAIGERGAAHVFGPQKGANAEQVEKLAANLKHFFEQIKQYQGVDIAYLQGTGAAGALSGGLMAFLPAKIVSGIDLIIDHFELEELFKNADYLITGEGQIDEQTIHGKGPIGIAQRAKKHGVSTIAIVGGLNIDDEKLHESGIDAALSIVSRPMVLETAIKNARSLVENTALRLGYLLQI